MLKPGSNSYPLAISNFINDFNTVSLLTCYVSLYHKDCITVMLMCHQDNMSVKCIPPYTPLLFSKTGVFRGITIFSYFFLNIDCGYSLEQPLIPTIYVLSKNKKNFNFFQLKIFNFYSLGKTCILYGCVFVIVFIHFRQYEAFLHHGNQSKSSVPRINKRQ